MKSIFKQNKFLLAVTFIFSMINSIAYVYIAIILQDITNIAISGDTSAFGRILVKSVLYLILLGLLSYIYSICSKRLVCRIIKLFRKKVFDGVLRRNAQDFSQVNTADYLSAFFNDIKLVEENFIIPFLMAFQNIIMFLAALTVLFIINPMIGLCLIGCLVLMLIIPSIFGKAMQERQDRLSKKLSVFTAKIKDILSGYEIIKSYNIGRHIESEFNRHNDDTTAARFHADKMIAANESVSEVLAYLTIFSGFFIGTYLIIIGSISPGTLLALIQLSSSFVNPLLVIMQCFPKMQGVKPVLDRLEEISSYEDESFTGTKEPSFNKSIKTEGLGFSYNKDQQAVSDVNLTINKGMKYAVVGHSGCGKSTLIKLLTGNLSNFDGSVMYDGINIMELDIGKLREKISVIHQNIYMFDDSIKENICLYESYSEDKLNEAIELSGINEFLSRMPDGILSSVGENGMGISGGQRQRIAVARALIRKKPILVLDEGTTAIDMQTAYDIESKLLKIDDLTLITITHNMSPDILGLYDQIIYMENGKINEAGSLFELLSQGGRFSQFFYLKKSEPA